MNIKKIIMCVVIAILLLFGFFIYAKYTISCISCRQTNSSEKDGYYKNNSGYGPELYYRETNDNYYENEKDQLWMTDEELSKMKNNSPTYYWWAFDGISWRRYDGDDVNGANKFVPISEELFKELSNNGITLLEYKNLSREEQNVLHEKSQQDMRKELGL